MLLRKLSYACTLMRHLSTPPMVNASITRNRMDSSAAAAPLTTIIRLTLTSAVLAHALPHALAESPVVTRSVAAGYHAALDSITSEDLYAHTSLLADDTLEGRTAGSRGGNAAARYLEKLLSDWGVQPAGNNGYTQRFSGRYQNVLARIEGVDQQLKHEIIVVGAHYDHVGYGTPNNSYGPLGFIHNGADDNASGVAVLLEVIQAISRQQLQPRRTILFVFWDAEEQGLLGSWHWVRQPTVPLRDVRMSINIDMVGRLRKGRLEIDGSRTGFGLRRLAATDMLPDEIWQDFSWELKENSDHWPFIQRQIPTLMLHTGLHEDYHRPSDDLEKLNLEGMRYAARHLLRLVVKAADAQELPTFRPAGLRESPSGRQRLETPVADLPPRLGITFRQAPLDAGAGETPGESAPAEDVETTASSGVVAITVREGSPADRAGINVGDRIVAVGGRPTPSVVEFAQAIMRAPAVVTLTVIQAVAEPGTPADQKAETDTDRIRSRGPGRVRAVVRPAWGFPGDATRPSRMPSFSPASRPIRPPSWQDFRWAIGSTKSTVGSSQT